LVLNFIKEKEEKTMKKMKEMNMGIQHCEDLSSLEGKMVTHAFQIHASDKETKVVYQDQIIFQFEGGEQLEIRSLPLHYGRRDAKIAHVYVRDNRALEITRPDLIKQQIQPAGGRNGT
jgi:hypothetical protein